jgi:phosphoribosyl 1,2-cyclic phosphate phosphodiesterase
MLKFSGSSRRRIGGKMSNHNGDLQLKPKYQRENQIIFLGSGGPFMLPQFFCKCDICNEARKDPSQRRTRASVAIVGDEVTLIDAGPDMEMQLEREKIEKIDNIFITHWHYDHIAGLGAIGYPQSICGWDPIDVYVPENLISHFTQELSFLSEQLVLHPMTPGDIIALSDASWEVVKTAHTENSVGFIIESGTNAAYLVDTTLPPSDTARRIRNMDLVILDAMFDGIDTEWRHFTVQEAIDFWKSTGIKECILTHLSCHRWENRRWIAGFTSNQRKEIERQNPGLQFAYDGMRISL